MTDVCVVGGGPAGMMLAVLLLREGLMVTVLEKHADFLRDFRGDTIHASTLNLMDELGWADEFLRLPHQKIRRLSGVFGGETYAVADCTRLPGRHKYIALMPQWDFLDFLAAKARQLHLAPPSTPASPCCVRPRWTACCASGAWARPHPLALTAPPPRPGAPPPQHLPPPLPPRPPAAGPPPPAPVGGSSA